MNPRAIALLVGTLVWGGAAPAQAEPIAHSERPSESCRPAKTIQDLAALEADWSDALRDLVAATRQADKPWGCPDATLLLDVADDGATLRVERSGGDPMSRHLSDPADVVVMGKAMLARALPPVAPAQPMPEVVAAPAPRDDAPDDVEPPVEAPRAYVQATGVARYMGVSQAVTLGVAGRGTIPIGRWHIDLGMRYVTLGADVGERPLAQEFDMSELTILGGVGYALVENPLMLRVSLFGALAVVDMDLDQETRTSEFEVESGAVDGRLGAAFRMSVPMVGPLLLVTGIDAEIAPASLATTDRRIDPLLPPMPAYTLGIDFGLEFAIP